MRIYINDFNIPVVADRCAVRAYYRTLRIQFGVIQSQLIIWNLLNIGSTIK